MTSRSCQMPILQERLLLQELNHRISNEFTSAIDVMSRAAARSNNKEVKAALADATELMHHYADVHHALRMPEHDGRMDAAASLRKLCLSISRSKLDRMKTELVLVASNYGAHAHLSSAGCWITDRPRSIFTRTRAQNRG
jgi:two-component sensor histidine kinase